MQSACQPLTVNVQDNATGNTIHVTQNINNHYHFHGPPSPGGPPHLVEAYATQHPEWVEERNRKWDEQNRCSDCSSDAEEDDYEQPLTSAEQMQLFDPSELVHTEKVMKNKKMVDWIVSQIVEDPINGGVKLMGGCTKTCINHCVDMKTEFAPRESHINVRTRSLFLNAMECFKAACNEGDVDSARKWKRQVETNRSRICLKCFGVSGRPSPAKQACKSLYEEVRLQACLTNNGCHNQDCIERGIGAESVLEGDHLHTAREKNDALRKRLILSSYAEWSCKKNGGVEGLKKEIEKGIEWPCAFCHWLRKSGSQANKYMHLNWQLLPDGSFSRHASEEEQQKAHYKKTARVQAMIVYPKMMYVDEIKQRVIGNCDYCKRIVQTGQEQCFHFDHVDETTKVVGKRTHAGKNGGVAGLVNNHRKSATLENFQGLIDAEIAKCRLLCINCHKRKTNGIIRFNVEKNAYEKVV